MKHTKRVIETPAPIPMDLLKLKFTEDVHYVIDYSISKFKGKVLITYLTNLNLSCEIKFPDLESELQVFKEYLSLPSMVNVPQFEHIAMHVLLSIVGDYNDLTFDPTPFTVEHADILARWLTNISMLPTYTFHCHPRLKDLVSNYNEVDDDLRGINFVNLIKHPDFPLLIDNIPESDWCWNHTFFTEPCFAGKGMFDFFSSKNNPYFMALLAMEDSTGGEKLLRDIHTTVGGVVKMMEGVSHVSPD